MWINTKDKLPTAADGEKDSGDVWVFISLNYPSHHQYTSAYWQDVVCNINIYPYWMKILELEL